MFIPTIMGQGTGAQQAEWIEKAWDCKIIGTYAQVCHNFYVKVSYSHNESQFCSYSRLN